MAQTFPKRFTLLPAAKGAVRKKKVAEVLERRCNGSTVEVRRYVKDVYVLCYGDWSPTDARFFGVDIDPSNTGVKDGCNRGRISLKY